MNKVQKLLSRKETRLLTTLSLSHIDRLEKAHLFPQRLRLTPHPRGRCAYVYDEVIEFMTRRAQERADRSR